MAIAFVAQANTSSLVNTLTINVPAGTAVGHTMVAFIRERSIRVITPPAGWTEDTSSPQTVGAGGASELTVACYYRTATGAEPASYTWTVAANQTWSGGILTYSGASTVDPVDVSSGNTGTDGVAPLNVVALSVTTTQANDMLLCMWASLNNPLAPGTWTLPAGVTLRMSCAVGDNGALQVAEKLIAAPGATGNQQADLAFITGTWGAFQVALQMLTEYAGPRIQTI